MKKRKRRDRAFYLKWILIVLLASIVLFFITAEINACIFSYQWSGTYPDHWNLQWYEDLKEAFHIDFHYIKEEKYLRTLGSPDGTREGLAEVYDFSAPTEQDAVLPDNGEPHHPFFRIDIPEQGLSLRQHESLWSVWLDNSFLPDQIVLTSDHFRFGRLEIGVGSTRQDVERAYWIEPAYASYNVTTRLITSHRLPPEERAEDFSLGYRIGYRDMSDSGMDILFRFDQNNRVDMMVLNFASGMP